MISPEQVLSKYKDRISIRKDSKFSILIKGYNKKLLQGTQIVMETNHIDQFHSQKNSKSMSKKIKYTILKTHLSKQQQLIKPQNLKSLKIGNQATKNLLGFVLYRNYLQTIEFWKEELNQKVKCLNLRKKTQIFTYYFKIIILDLEQNIIIVLFYNQANQKMFNFLEKGRVYTFKKDVYTKIIHIFIIFNYLSFYKIIKYMIYKINRLIKKLIQLWQFKKLLSQIFLQEIKKISGMGINGFRLMSIGQTLGFITNRILQIFLHITTLQFQIILIFIEVQALHEWLLEKDLNQIMKPDYLTVNLKQLEEKAEQIKEKYNWIFDRIIKFSFTKMSEQEMPQIFIMNIKIIDVYNSIEAIVFDDSVVKLLGLTTDQCYKLTKSQQNTILIVSKFRNLNFKFFLMSLMVKLRPKQLVVEIYDIDYDELAKKRYEDL
ncbi:unnamed protein product [Paramecium sonneborni]|uniref:Transmembrane protein n=1 Tax=Paramecium sonneborni TaxID=65129 RepID=A0A8S1KYV0_9CILI|nr:unnamed protein product [Paramecium sonneborni]